MKNKSTNGKTNRFKAIAFVAATLAMLSSIGMSGCVTNAEVSININNKTKNAGSTADVCSRNKIKSPWIKCNQNMAIAKAVSGFDMEIPFFSNFHITAMEGIINVDIPEDEKNTISFRKADKSINNPSDLYNVTYKESKNPKLKVKADMIYNDHNQIVGAQWKKDGYTYTISSTKPLQERYVVTCINSIANMN